MKDSGWRQIWIFAVFTKYHAMGNNVATPNSDVHLNYTHLKKPLEIRWTCPDLQSR